VTGDPEEYTHRLAARALSEGAPTAWFERLYEAADRGVTEVPWDREDPNPPLVEWLAARAPSGKAIVVGCGYGRDAEHLSRLGYETTAFDISPTAIDGARARHPNSAVHYEPADLLALPARWLGAFDLVVEVRNVQALPPPLHAQATDAVSSLVAPGGRLFVAGAVGYGAADGPPWPLTRRELAGFAVDGVEPEAIDVLHSESGVALWRAVFVRPG
jgi:SAM-dependent methyltransferase